MRIFLDVGANDGQTLKAALDPGFLFDRIVCFEPVKSCCQKLKLLADNRVAIKPYGLWNKNCQHVVFQPGSKGAGIYKKDNANERADKTELCEFRKASEWVRQNITKGWTVYLKLNCEGAECDIIDDLMDSGEFDKIDYMMVDFDVRKISALKHREAEVRERLSPYDFPRVGYCRQVMKGDTHAERIKHWLRLIDG